MTPEASPFHPAELALQEQFGRRKMLAAPARRFIRDHLVPQHREFFQQLPFLVVGSVDSTGQPWASIVAALPGFADSPDPKHLRVAAMPHPDDPLAANLAADAPVALLGIELATRRRNRLNGTVSSLDSDSWTVAVKQSYGNCPQYIQSRDLYFVDRSPATKTGVGVEPPDGFEAAADVGAAAGAGAAVGVGAAAGAEAAVGVAAAAGAETAVGVATAAGAEAAVGVAAAAGARAIQGDRLSVDDKSLIARADTFFIASSNPRREDGDSYGADVSHRGGRPGFVRIDNDSTLTVPDFMGNFFFNTIGNLQVNPRAGLLFPDFSTGDVLLISARAHVVWEGDEVRAFEGAQRLLRFEVEATVRLVAALPFRSDGSVYYAPELARTGTWVTSTR